MEKPVKGPDIEGVSCCHLSVGTLFRPTFACYSRNEKQTKVQVATTHKSTRAFYNKSKRDEKL